MINVVKRAAHRWWEGAKRLPTSMPTVHHLVIRKRCPYCGTDTRWVARAVEGYYRCLECGRDPLEHSRDHESTE